MPPRHSSESEPGAARPVLRSTPQQDAALEMDPVADLLGGGRTIAYKAVLAHACGGATVGLLLSQFWYWTNTIAVRERGGWFWKTMEEISEETGLTRTEQESARKKLKALQVLHEEFRDLPRKLYFHVDKGRLYEVLREQIMFSTAEMTTAESGNEPGEEGSNQLALYNAENPQYGSGKTRNMERGKSALLPAGNPQAIVTKTTSEITTEMSSKNTTTKSGSSAKNPTLHGNPTLTLNAVDVVAYENQDTQNTEVTVDAAEMAVQLITAGIGRQAARRLAAQYPEECRQQLAYLPYVADIRSTPGAYLRKAIEEGYGPPAAWTAEQRKETKRASTRVRTEEQGSQRIAEEVKRIQHEETKRRLRTENPTLWNEIRLRAEKMLAPPIRSRPNSPVFLAAIEHHVDVIVAEMGLST